MSYVLDNNYYQINNHNLINMPVGNAIVCRAFIDGEFMSWTIITVFSVINVNDWLP